jgi:hypothetical protein
LTRAPKIHHGKMINTSINGTDKTKYPFGKE